MKLAALTFCALMSGASSLSVGNSKVVRIRDRPQNMRMVVTAECATYDLMVMEFIRHCREVLGNTAFTILESCDDPAKSMKHLLPADIEVYNAPNEKSLRKKGVLSFKSFYPWVSRPYAVAEWLEKSDVKEDIIVISEYDWTWLNPDRFWEWASKVEDGKPVAAHYQYLEEGIRLPNTVAPILPGNVTSSSAKAMQLKNLQPVMVPIMVKKNDLKKTARRWAELTNDMLTTQEKAPNFKMTNRVTEMYSWLAAAAEAGLNHEVISHKKQFSPGYWLGEPEGEAPLFGHYCFSFHLCGKEFNKYHWYGTLEKTCQKLNMFSAPEAADIAKCEYMDYGKAPHPDAKNAPKVSQQMMAQMYKDAKAVCASANVKPASFIQEADVPELPHSPTAAARHAVYHAKQQS